MDIAKIRKKLRESEAGKQPLQANGRAVPTPADRIPPDEKSPETAPAEKVPGLREKEESSQEIKLHGQKEREKPEKKDQTPPERTEEQKRENTEEIIEILTFTLVQQEFAFRVTQLDEILRYQWTTRIPQIPSYVIGVTSLRGKVIPIIDLKLKLSLTEHSQNSNNNKGKMLIVKGPKGPIGVTVDRVIGVVRIGASEILPPPSHLSEVELKFIEGVAVVEKRFVSIINMEEAVALHIQ
jgi:purine-binding chemotaxis protein CheW